MTYSTVFSHLRHFQRIASVYHGRVLVHTAVYVAHAAAPACAACHVASLALVVLHKVVKRVGLASIALDAFHDALAADGAVIRHIIIHARVLL